MAMHHPATSARLFGIAVTVPNRGAPDGSTHSGGCAIFGAMRFPRAPRIAALVAALACGSGTRDEAPGAQAAPEVEADLAAARLEVAMLREALAEERGERQALEIEVERLREEVDELAWSDEQEGPADEGSGEHGGGKGKERPWFDADSLLEHGVQPAEVDRLREAFDESELALLELENQARREGWFRKPRYREDLRDMRQALRAELGDDRFDRLLYATGRQNRVVVADLLQGSAAQRGGLQTGDEILSYADQRVFRGMELKQATTEGTPGERVSLEVMRDGSRVRLWVPRGPLGIRMRQASRPPPW